MSAVRIESAAPPPALAIPAPREASLDPALLPAFVAPPGDLRPVDRLLLPGALAVTTGQQPGLLSGPLYTIYKALSAASVARWLEATWQRPVVPVFWVAGDDHDFAEAARVAWNAGDGGTAHAVLRERPAGDPMTPMYREPLGPEIEMVLAGLESALAPSEHRDEVVTGLRRHYRPEATVAGSFAGLMAEWLAPFGVAVFDPTHLAAKQAQAPLLMRALEASQSISERLSARQAQLVAQGIDSGVPLAEGASLVMVEGVAGRDRLVHGDGGFVSRRGQERFPMPALASIASDHPERLSANVLLRPVVESSLLPAVAYIAGPAERRYLELARPVYEVLGEHAQATLPRWSGMLVESKVTRVLEKFGASLPELLEPGQRLEARVARQQLPPEATEALARLRHEIEAGYDVLARAAVEIDPTIERTLRTLGGQAISGTADAEKRLLSHLKKRQAVETQQIGRARELLLPGGEPQERVLTLAPWLARHGMGLLRELAAVMDDWYRVSLEPPLPPS